MATAKYLVAANGKESSIVYGAARSDGQRPTAIPMRFKDAEEFARNLDGKGQIVIYKLVPVKNFWHDPPAKDQ